jgi:hypothetical protein
LPSGRRSRKTAGLPATEVRLPASKPPALDPISVGPRDRHLLSGALRPRVGGGRARWPPSLNRSARDAVYLEVDDRKEEDQCDYSDVDLHYGPRATDGKFGFTRKNGEPY